MVPVQDEEVVDENIQFSIIALIKNIFKLIGHVQIEQISIFLATLNDTFNRLIEIHSHSNFRVDEVIRTIYLLHYLC